ncbi:MAG: prepilin-type N-terminal cleavage/methylation domain-containing protein, partial [Alphaproteobacteria bacterium]|nr:prepilin-type N-terminal cleavage/methylation domain-containing protein [Alphaproteobacteria bacterium]
MKNFEIKNIDCHAALAMTKNSQSGRSMIEMLGVLAIIGVLSVGGIAGYSKAMMKYRINKTIEQITLIAGNVRAFWGSQKNYIEVECCSYWKDGSCGDQGCSNTLGTDIDGNLLHTYKGCPIHKKAKIFPDEMITVTD